MKTIKNQPLKKYFFENNFFALGTFIAVYLTFVILYFIWLSNALVDAPYVDDYPAILGSVIHWINERSIGNLFETLLLQHNEHKILLVRLAAIIQYELVGKINFATLAILGNLFYVALPFVFFKITRAPIHHLLLIVPLFTNIRPEESALWSMASLSNFPVVALAGCAAIMAFSQTYAFNILGACVLVLTTLTQGNGIIMHLILTAWIALSRPMWLRAAYLISLVFALLCYFYGWHSSSIALQLNIKSFFVDPTLPLRFSLAMLGSSTCNPEAAVIVGACLTLIYLCIKLTKPKASALDMFVVFIILSCCATSISRCNFGIEAATASRYSIYGCSMLASVLLMVLDEPWNKAYKISAWVFFAILSVSFFIYSQQVSKKDIERFRVYKEQVFTDQTRKIYAGPAFLIDSNEIKMTLQQSISMGIYLPPTREVMPAF